MKKKRVNIMSVLFFLELSGALQIVNLLKLLIDPENMLSVANKSEKTEFLAYFYRKSMRILLAPLLANTSGGTIIRGLFSSTTPTHIAFNRF